MRNGNTAMPGTMAGKAVSYGNAGFWNEQKMK